MKKYLFILLISGIFLLSNGVFAMEKRDKTFALPADYDTFDVAIYYKDADGYMIPMTRKIKWQDGVARGAISALIHDTKSSEQLKHFGIYQVLPNGTEILGLNIKQGTATIDFGIKLLNYSSKLDERDIISSVVYTLTEFSTIKSVKILINGQAQGKLKYGTDISGELSRENTLINAGQANLGSGKKLDIYLFKSIEGKYNYLLPVSIQDAAMQDKELPERIIDYLGRNYADTKLYTEIPSGTKLLKSNVKGNTLVLDFDSSIRNYGGTVREEGILEQILYPMKQIKGIEKVKILINGKEGSLPEGTDIKEEIALPYEINTVVE